MITTFTYDRANRLKLADAGGSLTTYAHDAAGHRTEARSESDLTAYTWTAAGRMATAEPVTGLVEFACNADGQRVAKTAADGSVTGYLYDGKNLLHETDDVGGEVGRTLCSTADEEYGDLVGEDGDGEIYPQYDAQGNVAAVLDGDGEVLGRFKYSAFGAVAAALEQDDEAWSTLSADQWSGLSEREWRTLVARPDAGTGDALATLSAGRWSGTTADGWSELRVNPSTSSIGATPNLGMAGRKQYYLDPETRLYLLGMGNGDGGGGRYYDTATGRFLSEDPIRQSGGDDNLYRYVGNDPVNKVDPSGHEESARQKDPKTAQSGRDRWVLEGIPAEGGGYERQVVEFQGTEEEVLAEIRSRIEAEKNKPSLLAPHYSWMYHDLKSYISSGKGYPGPLMVGSGFDADGHKLPPHPYTEGDPGAPITPSSTEQSITTRAEGTAQAALAGAAAYFFAPTALTPQGAVFVGTMVDFAQAGARQAITGNKTDTVLTDQDREILGGAAMGMPEPVFAPRPSSGGGNRVPTANTSTKVDAAATAVYARRLTAMKTFRELRSAAGSGPNLAFIDFEISGIPQPRLVGMSGRKPRAGFVKMVEKPQFKTIEAETPTRFRPADVDTERILLEELAAQLDKLSSDPALIRGKGILASEYPTCESCENVIAQFKSKFPNFFLEIDASNWPPK